MKTEEQSSTSVTKKIITPNKELLGLKKSEEQKEVTKETSKTSSMPTGWRMLVLPFKMNEKTKGGVLLRTQKQLERQQVGSQCGNVLSDGS